MKNIIPFKKDIIFKTNLSEVTSISLEHTLNIKDNILKGNFTVSGDYKITDESTSVEDFSFDIPFEIMVDEKYDTSKALVDIDDFYYEIVNNNVLSVSIDVLLDKLEEKELIQFDDLVEIKQEREVLEDDDIMPIIDTKEEIKEDPKEKVVSLFNNFSKESEVYVTYNVFILREGDNIDSIMEKYNVDLDTLEKYNDLSNLKVGDKLIIPN